MGRSNVSSKAEYWQRVLDEQRLSKLSVAVFCSQNSIMGLMNPFDTDSIARSLTTETKADTTNGPQRPKPSDIHLVYSIYGIVSEHTPEELEVIREYQRKGRTWEEWMMGGERKRMDAAGFKTSFRKL